MGNTRNTGYLQNAIKVADDGNISLMHGSTMLMQISSSGAITTTGVISGSNALSASYAETASFVTLAQTASFVANAQSASNAVTATTASFANAFTVAGNLTAQTLVVQTITSSVDFVTGSTQFGSLLTNTHVFSGSVSMNPGGLFVSGSGNVGIGTINPSYKLSVANELQVGAQGGSDFTYIAGGSGYGSIIRNIYATGGVNNEIRGNGDNYFNAILGNTIVGGTSSFNKLSVRGNIDLGATGFSYAGPSQYGGLMFPRGQILYSNSNSQNQFYLSSNAYTNVSGVFAYRNSGQPALALGLDNGGMAFLTAGNGTADATISWTTAMGISNNGTVTRPNQPAFLAYSENSGFTVTGGGWYNISNALTVESYDISSNYSGGRFTAPVAGRYFFYAGGWSNIGSASNGERYAWSAVVNNGSQTFLTGGNYSLTDTPLSGYSVVYNLNAGDYVDLFVFSAVTGTWGAGTHRVFFGGYLL